MLLDLTTNTFVAYVVAYMARTIPRSLDRNNEARQWRWHSCCWL